VGATGSSEDDNEGQFTFLVPFALLIFPARLDDEFMDYCSDYETHEDAPNAQVDIDPYAGLSARPGKAGLAKIYPQAFSFPRTGEKKSLKLRRSPR
jgi:hypothetical protein